LGTPNQVAGEQRTVFRGPPGTHSPAPLDAAARHYNPSVAFAMMLRWISLDPA
jgi:hypothetical protein